MTAPKLTDDLVRKFGVRVCWHPDDLHMVAGNEPFREEYRGIRSARAVTAHAGTKSPRAWVEVNYANGRDGRPLWQRFEV